MGFYRIAMQVAHVSSSCCAQTTIFQGAPYPVVSPYLAGLPTHGLIFRADVQTIFLLHDEFGCWTSASRSDWCAITGIRASMRSEHFASRVVQSLFFVATATCA